MEYKKFVIEKYRAINKPISIDVVENKLICVIGENECGKSTILQGIYAFDSSNDEMTQGIHLKDVGNLCNIGDNNLSKITATINIKDSKGKINEIIKKLNANSEEINSELFTITRTINGGKFYSIKELSNESKDTQNLIAEEVIKYLPKIIYFDDFTDPLPNKINLKEEGFKTWVSVIDLLIQSIDSNLTIDNLTDPSTGDNQIRSICASMSRELNSTIVSQWKEIRLEKGKTDFRITVDFDRSNNTVEFKLIEEVNGKDDRFFDIRQRSKGFYWFFNFVMRAEFNPKGSFGSTKGAIFLFDEPGSYLHVSMQNSLCKKLKLLSRNNVVIYCTHSPELIDYETIDKTWICYREMFDNGNILLKIASDFYELKDVDQNRKKIIIEPLINKSIIFELYHPQKEGKCFKKTGDLLKKVGVGVYSEVKDLATALGAKTIAEMTKKS